MTHVYERGQLVIPKYLRELLKWDAGTEVVMRAESNRLVVEKKTSAVDELERFAMEHPLDFKSDAEIDASFKTAMKRKYTKMGLA